MEFPAGPGGRNARISQWLGGEEEEVMVCAFVGRHIHEAFHRQDFFFLNFAYRGDYRALSARFDNEILVREGDCYIGQPYSGYALRGNSDRNLVIAGLLIRKDVFFNEYLAPLSSEPDMLRFFLEPKIDRFSDEFIHFTLARTSPIWKLLELMMVEYADRQEDTQQVLKPLIFSTLMLAAREYRRQYPREQHGSVAAAMTFYMERHLDGITLGDLAQHFGYHPNYISALLHRETGRTFSQILLEKRMQRAVLLLKNTDLPVEHVAEMTGYGNPSNFYKAFRSFYGMPPRVYLGQ